MVYHRVKCFFPANVESKMFTATAHKMQKVFQINQHWRHKLDRIGHLHQLGEKKETETDICFFTEKKQDGHRYMLFYGPTESAFSRASYYASPRIMNLLHFCSVNVQFIYSCPKGRKTCPLPYFRHCHLFTKK